MLAGLRSRWMMPFSCAASSASAICFAMARTFAIAGGSKTRLYGMLVERLALNHFEHQRIDPRMP